MSEINKIKIPKLKNVIGIYCIENTINNKKYIGQSRNAHVRTTEHKCRLKNGNCQNIHLQKAYDIHDGINTFEYYLLEICTLDELDKLETYWINKLKTRNRDCGYNSESGGHINKTLSEETKMKIMITSSKRITSEETKLKISKANTGKKHTQKSIEKMKLVQKGHKGYTTGMKHTDDAKQKISDSKRGKHLSEETKQKISNSKKGVKKDVGDVKLGKKNRKNTSSHFYGVSFNKQDKIWITNSTDNNKNRVYLGRYKTEEDAALAYNNYIIANNFDRPLNIFK